MSINPVSSSANELVPVLVGLEIQSGVKTKRLVSVYSCSASYKKPKKLTIIGNVVGTSAGFLVLTDMVTNNSKVNSEASSISSISNLENIKDTVVEKTSYTDFNALKINNTMDDTTLRKTHIRTYVLDSKPKTSFFDNLSNDNNDVLTLPVSKFSGVKHLANVKSHVLNRCNFKPVKSFALNIKLSAISEKTNSIIRTSFTFEFNMNKAKKLAICKKIIVNNNLRKVNICSDQKIIVKKIPVNLSKSAVESVFSKFGKVMSIKIQLISLWQKVLVEFDSFEVANLVAFKWSVFMEKNSHKTLLYTLSVGTTAHNLSGLLELYGERICFIGCNPSSYVRDRCAVVCFANKASKLAVIGFGLVFKAGLFLACCATCKQFEHILDACLVGGNSRVCEKQMQASIICPVSFGTGLSSGAKFSIGAWSFSNSADLYGISGLFNHLVFLEQSLELLTDQISDIVRKLSFVELVLLPSVFCELPLAVSTLLAPEINLNMVLDGTPKSSAFSLFAVVDDTSGFSLSSSKILTTKMGGLESKMTSLEASISSKFVMCNIRGINVFAKQVDTVHCHISSENMVSFITETKLKFSSWLWIKDKYDGAQIFTFGLDVRYLGAGVAVVMNNSLAHHVSKIEVVSGQVISVRLLFKGNLSVFVISLYASVSAGIRFGQASEINSIIAKAVNTSTFMVLGGNFNKCKCYVVATGRGIELLIAKIVKNLESDDAFRFDYFVEKWLTLDANKALVLKDMVHADQKIIDILKYLSIVRKEYRKSKIYELKLAQEAFIRAAIEKHMKKFCLDKSSIIKSVLDRPFQKVVLDHLLVDDELVLDSDRVKLNVDRIMEGWTRKCVMLSVLSDHWAHQYITLDYVRNNVFSGVMDVINMSQLLVVVGSLSDGKAAGLSSILNEL
ncbi:hypothetical protein G9A89_020223 [Geosiphon pyriformis]|nr:hypothetical protein G9A89_020223 [Geosiphon pyriformis]